jgi:hypothetical protein
MPWGFQEVEAPSWHIKVVRLTILRTGRLYPPRNIPGTHLCWGLRRPQCHSVAVRIMSMKNSSDAMGDRTLDLTACSAVPQPTASPRAPSYNSRCQYWMEKCVFWGAELFVHNIPVFIQGNCGKVRIISVGFGWMWARVWTLDPPTICCYSLHGHFRYATHNTIKSTPTLPR